MSVVIFREAVTLIVMAFLFCDRRVAFHASSMPGLRSRRQGCVIGKSFGVKSYHGFILNLHINTIKNPAISAG
jgi:hypothetical protein